MCLCACACVRASVVDPWVDFFGVADVKTAHRKLLPFCLVVYPLAAIVVAVLLGGPLAACEGWSFAAGFVLVLGELVVPAVPLVLPGTGPPTTAAGKALGLISGIVAMAFFGLVIAVGSVPLLGFGLTFDESKVVKSLAPLVLNGEQREEILGAPAPKAKKAKVLPESAGGGILKPVPASATMVEAFDAAAPGPA